MMGWYGGGGMGLWGWLFMGVFWLLLLALIVWLVVRLLPGGERGGTYSPDSALEILDRRLANGEIDLETWRAQRSALVAARGERR